MSENIGAEICVYLCRTEMYSIGHARIIVLKTMNIHF